MYIPCLNGIRAFAICLVLASHLIHSGIPQVLVCIFQFGSLGTLGVRLFFVLSGFLITEILLRELVKTGKIRLKRFFMRRILRIFPCFYSYLVILVVLSKSGLIQIEIDAILFALLYMQNLNVFQNTDLFSTSWLVIHSWSLSVEEQFYVIYPFILGSQYRKLNRRSILIPTAISFTIFCSFFRVLNYSFPDVSRILGGPLWMHCDFLLYGALLNYVLRKNRMQISSALKPYGFLLLAIPLPMLLLASRVEYYSAIHILIAGNLILIGDIFILSFFILFPDSIAGKLLETKLIKGIGIISYGLYVWQQLFLGSTSLWIKMKFLTLFPTNIVMVFACALISYYLIERPFLRLKKAYA